MALELTEWNIQDQLDSPERMIGYLEAAFEEGDPEFIATAIQDVARAKGITITPDATDIGAIIRMLKAAGFELTAKAA